MRQDSRCVGGIMMTKIYNFNESKVPSIEYVGGKANSLIRLTKGGFRVPGGSVLTVAFFEKWISQLQCDPEFEGMWKDPSQFKSLGSSLKAKAKNLFFSEEQKSIILAVLKQRNNGALFAVRSSSPEEDLAGASFAGGYETILGVNESGIFEAVKKAFISCLDERVFYYKHQNGFDSSVLRIAVVIQEQIASEISGVGFSLNPLNNCFDEAVINANTGLGESVVSGMITPDEFIVDKSNLSIMESKIGSKEHSIVLDGMGGTKVVAGLKEEPALKEAQILELTDLIIKVEKYYEMPMDIEWAYYDNTLYLLQARPITTYVPLPKEMQTIPGENKILYLDASLTKQGITSPISVLGCDILEMTQKPLVYMMMGVDACADVKGGMLATLGGRMYKNLSTDIKLLGLKRVKNIWKTVDVSTVELLENLDVTLYIPEKLHKSMKGAIRKAIVNNLGTLKYIRRASKNPTAYKKWYQPFEDDFDQYLREIVKQNVALSSAVDEIIGRFIVLLDKMMTMTYAAELARKSIGKQLEKYFPDGKERMQYLERSLPDNITIDMGMKMYELSQMDDIKGSDFASFEAKLVSGDLSSDFIQLWREYMDWFGCRTNNEMDTGVPRTSENIEGLFNQIKGMSSITGEFSPLGIYEKSKNLREKTFNDLVEKLSSRSRKRLEQKYNVLVSLGGKREALKYWYVRSLTAIRELILAESARLVGKGLLENKNDIFWLKFEQIVQSSRKNKEELAVQLKENQQYYRLLDQVHSFPKLIDSRGKILTMPPVEAREGEVVGQPISPGKVKGRVKVLSTPDEKPLLPGEILVTRATDPGWTPLFINASAIILEVGGLLQHGALVAREYGKPCIAGIEDAMNILKNGQLIEVDGSRGLITILDKTDEKIH